MYPSYYEGWGLPVSEALTYGKAVIASAAEALPEASGGCALHLTPYDTRDWRYAICRMAFDHEWRREWELRATRDFMPRDWGQGSRLCAGNTLHSL
ncbi:MAG: glycosyltransferase [Blastomonas fulva]|uniref:glycosyltransferase n=1 Tax=Blastomonas fulva TaxID=1550728 RepID=UPI003D2B5A8C|nr:glycosyltransferase [Blastomonas fulva]